MIERYPTYGPPTGEADLRAEVREFVQAHSTGEPCLGMRARHDPEFSRRLAQRGWVGMALPKQYGGSEKRALERWIVVEELLALSAPVGAHWIADRQTGPLLARFGSEEIRQRFLPSIAAGECWISVGMSEADAGSDLASVRTTATKVDGGYEINGTKIWTSDAHTNHYVVALCRTDPLAEDRRRGLSQFIIDLASPGVGIHPIDFLDGSHHFNEVVFEGVFVPAENLIGERGQGWAQVTSELVSERGGPDRYMSVYRLLELAFEHVPDVVERHTVEVGTLLARFATLRRMSMSIAAMSDDGVPTGGVVPMVKDLGTTFEQETVRTLRNIVATSQRLDHHPDRFAELLTRATLTAPSFTIRGGTNEILRNLVARSLS
jgi:alkylation response protein AidB-like acyl-CoA dehydrogenase